MALIYDAKRDIMAPYGVLNGVIRHHVTSVVLEAISEVEAEVAAEAAEAAAAEAAAEAEAENVDDEDLLELAFDLLGPDLELIPKIEFGQEFEFSKVYWLQIHNRNLLNLQPDNNTVHR